MIKAQIIGNLGKDAEVRTLDSGMRVISFSVAHTEKWKKDGEDKEKTIWVNCTIWRGAEASVKIADYLKKGQKVYVEGEPSARGWKNDSGDVFANLEYRVVNVELLGKNDTASSSESSSSSPSEQTNTSTKVTNKPGDDDDLPF